MLAIGSFVYLNIQHTLEQSKREMSYYAKAHAFDYLAYFSQAQGVRKEDQKEQGLKDFVVEFERLSDTGQLRFFSKEKDVVTFLNPARNNTLSEELIQSFVVEVIDSGEQSSDWLKAKNGNRSLVVVRYFPDTETGFVLLKDRREIVSFFLDFRDIFLASLGCVGVLLILILLFAKQFMLRPLQEITNVAKEIEKGNYQNRAGFYGKNEIGLLSHAFNKMSRELIQSNIALDQKVKEKTEKLQQSLKIVHAQKIQGDAILSSISEGMVATDEKGEIIVANEAFEHMFQTLASKVTGKPIWDVCVLQNTENKNVEKNEHPVFVSLAEKKKIHTDHFLAKRNKGFFPVELSVAPVMLHEEMIGSILILSDRTKEKEIDKMKTEFISIASHQLRGPLAALKWYGDWVGKEKAGKLKKEQKECVEKMNISTKTMITLVDDFLNVSRIEQGKTKNPPTEEDVQKILEDMLSVLEHDIVMKRLQVKLRAHGKDFLITTDQHALREIMTNFISNAIKYTPEQGLIVIEFQKQPDAFLFQVENSGPGIPTKEQEKIFTKFFRASTVVKEGITGTGLGLYAAKQLAESLGGQVGFISEEAKTTKFWVRIPHIK